jgi:hypothetical protein
MAYASSLYANGWACQSHMRPLQASRTNRNYQIAK